MKKFVSFAVILIVVLSGVFSVLPAAAQGPDPCTDQQIHDWAVDLVGYVDRYEAVVAESASLQMLPAIQAIANIQAMRREYETIAQPACELTPKPQLVADMFNLRTDSMILAMLGDPQAESLKAQAEAAFQQVKLEVGGVEVVYAATNTPTTGGKVPAFTYPASGAIVPRQVNVQGTINPADKGNNDMWLFVKAPDGRYYPQVNYACDDPATIDLPPNHTRWSMTVFLGAENTMDSGAMFELVLGTLSPDITQQIYDRFANEWCPDNFQGYSQVELYDGLQFNELDYLEVIRE